MVPREELLSRYRTEIHPELLNPPLELWSFMTIVDEHISCLSEVEESGLDTEFSDIKLDAFSLIVEAFMQGVDHLLDGCGDMLNLKCIL